MRRQRSTARSSEATRSCAASRSLTRNKKEKQPAGRPGMEKRVVFASPWMPYALLAPQIRITIVFFFLPAFQAVWFSFQLHDAFGLTTEFVDLQNSYQLFADEHYLHSFKVTAVFSTLVAVVGIALS